jgi:hypothetical protein
MSLLKQYRYPIFPSPLCAWARSIGGLSSLYKNPTAPSSISNASTMIHSIATLGVLSALFHFSPMHAVPATSTDVPPPNGGLESNINYIFVNQNTENIQDLTATIFVTEDLQVSSTGVAFQLDCWAPSPKSSSDLALQEFGIFFDGTDIGGFIVTSTLSDFKKSTSMLNRRFVLENTTLSSDDTNKNIIPAGTTFTITLINDENGKITDAQFGLTKGKPETISIEASLFRVLLHLWWALPLSSLDLGMESKVNLPAATGLWSTQRRLRLAPSMLCRMGSSWSKRRRQEIPFMESCQVLKSRI